MTRRKPIFAKGGQCRAKGRGSQVYTNREGGKREMSHHVMKVLVGTGYFTLGVMVYD
jgi:hypothetical protein